MTALPEAVEAALTGLRHSGSGWIAKCPVHDDRNPSLSLTMTDDDKLLVHCHAGCDQKAVLDALGYEPPARRDEDVWTPRGPAVAVYDYVDEDGKLLFQVCRTADKQFPQRRPDPTAKSGWRWQLGDVRRVPFRLPELIKAVQEGRPVWITEGEKDALALIAHGQAATCNPGGAGKWRDEYNAFLLDATVTIWADADEPGRKHARRVADSLGGVAARVRIVEAAEGHKDAAAHLGAGLGVDQVRTITGQTTVPSTVVSSEEPADAGASNETPERLAVVEAPALFQQVMDVAEHGLGDTVMDFGLSDLDEPVKIRAGHLVVVGARPGVGKSVFLSEIAKHNALAGRPVLICSMEMTALEFGQRQLASHGRIDLRALTQTEMSDEDWQRAAEAIPELTTMPQVVIDQPGLGLDDIRELADKHRPSIILVDYLQLMKPPTREARHIAIGLVAQGCKELAKETGTALVCAAQLNRAGEQRTDKKPLLSDLRESGAIEQAADTVLLLHREELHQHETARAGELDVKIAKQRNGPAGQTVTLGFQGHRSRIVQLALEPSYGRASYAGPDDEDDNEQPPF